MSETITLSELQIKRRELENELASLSQKEKTLENDLRTLEEKIIDQLKEEIKAKKSALSSLESRKSDLEKKLAELQGKPAGSQTAEEQHANGETAEPVQQNNTEENDTELTVVGYQPEQIQETGQSTKEDDKRDWVF
jgi:peptidoglycan hydrolase CwlO-like protein